MIQLYHRVGLSLVALFSLALVSCGPTNDEYEEADAGEADVEPKYEPPDRQLMSSTLWETIQKISPPGGPAPPQDSTNRYADDERAIRLGQFLFYEEAISGNGEVSCASCHLPDRSFTDETPLPEHGITGPEDAPTRRTPSLLNAAYNRWYFWDGRVDTLWGQGVEPYESPIEMGGSRLQLANYVYDTPDVRRAYEEIFGDLPDRSTINPFPSSGRPVANPSSADEIALDEAWGSMTDEGREQVDQILVNVMKSIAAFEMQLVSFNSPFDRFVDEVRVAPEDPERWGAISPEAQEGMRLFVEVAGCMECHRGAQLSNDKFHNIGVPGAEWSDPTDPGRAEGLARAKESVFSSAGPYSDDPQGPQAAFLRAVPEGRNDLGAFRTPSLRNLGGRAPYMHAGQLADLQAVVEFYNEPPDDLPVIGIRSSDVDPLGFDERKIDFLVEFLESMEGEPVPEKFLSQPSSPLP